MYIESRERFIIDTFRKSFPNIQEPLLLYGTGRGTRAILQESPEYQIVGILDKMKTDGALLDVPIMDAGRAAASGAGKIVIVATQRHVPVIYRRIAAFCKENNIAAYDVNGQELAERYGRRGDEDVCKILSSKPYFGADEELAKAFIRIAEENPSVSEGSDGRLRITDMNTFAELFFAPLALGYTLWLMQQIRQEGCDYVLYMSRDAYLIQKIIEMLREKCDAEDFPGGEYFYTSRRAVSVAQIFDEGGAERLALEPFYGSIGELFRLRFGITVSPKYADRTAADTESLIECIGRYRQEILENSAQERENYLKYTEGAGIAERERIAVIDLYAHGTVQKGLEKILDRKLLGFYLKKNLIYGSEDDGMGWLSMFEPGYLYGGNDPLNHAMVWMEEIFSSQEPTLHGFDESGTPVFQAEPRSKDQLVRLAAMQAVILRYCEKLIERCPDLPEMPITSQILADIMELMDERYIEMCFAEKDSVVIGDGFSRPLAVEAVQR